MLKFSNNSFFLVRLPKSKKRFHLKNGNPGVGTYEDQSPRVKRKSPTYHIGQQLESKFDKSLRLYPNPSPAHYDAFKTSISNIKYSMPSKNDKIEI